jgi:hypothetical protein
LSCRAEIPSGFGTFEPRAGASFAGVAVSDRLGD